MMIQGIPVSAGIAIGKAFLYADVSELSSDIGNTDKKTDSVTELNRLTRAVSEAEQQLTKLIEQIPPSDGKQETDILNTQKYLLKDPEITGAAAKAIEQRHISAEQAVTETVQETTAIFEDMDDDQYLKERSDDIKDIGRRLLSLLSGNSRTQSLTELPQDSIVIARTLGPTDTVQLDRVHTAAIITEHGGQTSHTAILARTMGLPAVSGIQKLYTRVSDGDTVIVDGKILMKNKQILCVDEKQVLRDARSACKRLFERAGVS